MNNRAATPEPPPRQGQTEVTPLVIADLEARRAMGMQKYGTPLMVENGRDHLWDAYQEILDHTVYFRCAIAQREALWHTIDDIYTLAVQLKYHDPQLLAPLVEKLGALMTQRPQ